MAGRTIIKDNPSANLEKLNSIEGYVKYFMDPNLWTPYIQKAFTAFLGNAIFKIDTGIAGTYPTFIVNNRWVIKFFGQLFDGQESYMVEKTVTMLIHQQETFPAPKILFTGSLFPEESFSWPYLIYNFIPGISIGSAFERIHQDDLVKLANWLGRKTRILHETPYIKEIRDQLPKQASILNFDTNECIQRQIQLGILPDYLIDQIEPFLEATDKIELTSRPHHLIHADITADHILGTLNGDRWRTLAVIDYGDAMIGNLEYELVAIHLDLFKRKKELLNEYLVGYGKDIISQENIPLACLRMMLLHRFSVLGFLAQANLNSRNCLSLYHLADQLWDVDSPNNFT